MVVVGNELLSGYTQDANGPFLAGQLRELGHRVVRITIVPDTIEEIVAGLQEAGERAELLFVCGGLGPTQDDLTIEAVASFLHRPLETPQKARDQIRRIYRYGKQAGYLDTDEVDDGAWRMARIPKGGIVIPNAEGAAPGSVHTVPDPGPADTLYVLPGPPTELQSVFAHLLEGELIPVGQARSVEEIHLATFEAPVSSTLEELAEAFPEVEIGSYPQHGEKRVIVRLTGQAEDVQAAGEQLRAWLGEIELAPG